MEEQEKNAKSMDSPNVPSLTSPVVVTEPFFSLLGCGGTLKKKTITIIIFLV